MEVLVVESEAGAAAAAIAQLEAAGHQVKRCHEPDARPFPCAGLDPGHCPLEQDTIDVVLTVRASAHPDVSPLEDGVICALRRHAPVVVAGSTSSNPFERYAVAVSELDDVVHACERAARGPQIEHERVASEALRDTLGNARLPIGSARASVRRNGGGLLVTLHLPAETPRPVRDTAAVRALGAMRALDPQAPRIDVTLEEL